MSLGLRPGAASPNLGALPITIRKCHPMIRVTLLLVATLLLTACEPEVGTKAWCEMMDKKPKGDWSFNDAGDYAKHCVVR
jgi:hypothetical protein